MLQKLSENNLHDLFGLATETFTVKAYTVIAMDLLAKDLHSAFFNKSLSPRMIRPIAQQVFAALVALKKLGIIHGDIKPMNLMLVEPRSLKIKASH